jgi:hypothetical protein
MPIRATSMDHTPIQPPAICHSWNSSTLQGSCITMSCDTSTALTSSLWWPCQPENIYHQCPHLSTMVTNKHMIWSEIGNNMQWDLELSCCQSSFPNSRFALTTNFGMGIAYTLTMIMCSFWLNLLCQEQLCFCGGRLV